MTERQLKHKRSHIVYELFRDLDEKEIIEYVKDISPDAIEDVKEMFNTIWQIKVMFAKGFVNPFNRCISKLNVNVHCPDLPMVFK